MLVWVASYPRSGNTFLRIVLHRLYGVETSVIYDVDGVAERLGPRLVGFVERPAALAELRASEQVHFVKTHRPRDADAEDADPAICLVRDGRDSVVSWARLESAGSGRDFRGELERLIDGNTGAGSWGSNVLSWRQHNGVLLRYEDLVADPAGEVGRVLELVAPGREPVPGAEVPAFAELQRVDPGFFRRGETGSHRSELPEDLHRLFLARPDNAEAMRTLGITP